MKLWSDSFENRQVLSERLAFGRLGDNGQPMALSGNRNPHLAWSDAPEGTRSFAILLIDPDVPSVFDDANQAGRTIRADLPRQDFHHWAIVDIPATVGVIAEGECSDGVTSGGKRNPSGPAGSRQGINDYGGFMGDGDYFGYDGPCPPWNDALVHRYFFRLYALDVAALDLTERFGGRDVLRAIQGHVLAETAIHGSYTLNPALR
jgi:Raf kinase inhibitor-like YbhB/YbcL family protein